MHPTRKHLLGKKVKQLTLTKGQSVSQFLEKGEHTGLQLRNLGIASRIYKDALEKDAYIWHTVAGIPIVIGLGKVFNELMDVGFVDSFTSTGSQPYHDLNWAKRYGFFQGSPYADDRLLKKHGIIRIFDTNDSEEDLLLNDKELTKCLEPKDDKLRSAADAHHDVGGYIYNKYPDTRKNSFLSTAYKDNVPIYSTAFYDGSIGLVDVKMFIEGKDSRIDQRLDVLETTALVRYASRRRKKNAVVSIGGGTPKNTFMQTEPMISQILGLPSVGHEYLIYLTVEAPYWGSLSGAPPEEAISWGKVNPKTTKKIVVYSDFSITFPLLAQSVIDGVKPKKKKELYLVKDKAVSELVKEYYKSLVKEYTRHFMRLVENKYKID